MRSKFSSADGWFTHIVLLLCMTAVSFAQEIPAVPSPCKPCRTALRAWNQVPVRIAIVTIGNCSFRAFYKKRTCNYDACQELKMEKIEVFNPVPCNELLESEIPGAVLGAMIEKNAMGFQPDSIGPGSNGCWRFIRPSCWKVVNSPTMSCPPNSFGTPDLVDSFTVRYHIGELAPCDTASCCTNVIYPTLNMCGETIYDVPETSDYPWLHFLRNEPPDSSGKADFTKSVDAFTRQFEDTTCIACQSSGTPPPLPCKRSCPEDVMSEYRRIINARLKRLYGE